MQEPLKPFSFLGFGSGPRMCPGIHLAKLEISIFIHYLVCRYKALEFFFCRRWISFLAVEILKSLNSNHYLKFCGTRILFLKLWSFISQVESSGEGWLSPANTCTYAKKRVSDCSWVTVKLFCYRKSQGIKTREPIEVEYEQDKEIEKDVTVDHRYLIVKSTVLSRNNMPID